MHEKMYLKSINKDVITLYIRPDTTKQKVLDLLKREEPIINNIKSRVTREGIKASFQRVKTFIGRMSPSKKGYIICASSEKLVYIDDVLIEIDKYYCGGEFYATPLEEILALKLNSIGILTLDTKEATLAHIGNKMNVLKHLTSGISGKHTKGGQSQQRFQRNRDEQVKQFFTRIGEACDVFVSTYPITELIVAGSGLTKERFLKGDYLDYRIRPKVSIVLNTQYTGSGGIREALHLALPHLQKNAFAKEVQVVEDFFNKLGKHFEDVVYGEAEITQEIHRIKKIIKIEEVKTVYPKEMVVLHFRGEHYEKIKNLGGVVGIKC